MATISPREKNNPSFDIPQGPSRRARRLSAMTATQQDLKDGGVVVVPPRLLAQGRSKSYNAGFAASLEQARTQLMGMNLESNEDETAELTPPGSTPRSPKTPATPSGDQDELPSADSFAFAFDIDGVLIRGGNPIPEAIQAMQVLNGDNEYGVKM